MLGNWYGQAGEQMILVKPQGLENGERVLAVQLPNAATGMLVTTQGANDSDVEEDTAATATENPA